jgi:hypothetical protein
MSCPVGPEDILKPAKNVYLPNFISNASLSVVDMLSDACGLKQSHRREIDPIFYF